MAELSPHSERRCAGLATAFCRAGRAGSGSSRHGREHAAALDRLQAAIGPAVPENVTGIGLLVADLMVLSEGLYHKSGAEGLGLLAMRTNWASPSGSWMARSAPTQQ